MCSLRSFCITLLVIFFGFLLSLSHPANIFAHAGGGPPFLLINGKYAQTNTLYAGGSNISVSMDITPDKYLVNQPIAFVVDQEKLLVPKEVIEKSTWRWSWQEGSLDYAYGNNISHTFTNPGSYLLSLDVKAEAEPDFLTLDTIQVDIVENLAYKTPSVKIAVVGKSHLSGQAIAFEGQGTSDPDATVAEYSWYFGNENPMQQKNVSYTYKDPYLFDYIFLKARDSNGFYAYDAIQVSAEEGKIELYSLATNDTNVPVVQNSIVGRLKQAPLQTWLIAVFIVVTGSFSVILLKRKHRAAIKEK